MPNSRQYIVLVEDNEADAFLVSERLAETPGSAVHIDVANSLAQAMELLAVCVADAIVLDLCLPDSRGLETLRRIKAVAGASPIIVVSGECDERLRSQALAEGAEEMYGKEEANSRLFSRSVLYVVERNRARVQQQRLQDVLDATPDAIVVATPTGRVRFANAAAVHLLDRPRDALLAEPLMLSAALGTTTEIALPRADGVRHCEMRVTSLHWDGEPVHLASIRDLTATQQVEQLQTRSAELEVENRQIQQADRLKSQFLANMSHEIRTPMNAVIGLSYLLERSALNAEQAATLRSIKVASRSLLGIINNVLDVSKIEVGEMHIEQVPFSPAELMREIAQVMTLQSQERGIGFTLDMPGELPAQVEGDVTRLQQVLNNLVSNAIKFTEHGQVRLQVLVVTPADAPDQTVRLRFCCHDSGIGIAADALARLFTPFVQADDTTTRRFGGTGLGLSIVKQLATLMGGEVGARSEPGVGSEFWAELPFTVCAASDTVVEPARDMRAAPALRGVRVLVVDDSLINLQVAQHILELEGAHVSLASDGQQAVDFLRVQPQAVDVVLMDVQMPVLDGLDATHHIRAVLRLATLPIIALTAGLSGYERARVREAGMTDLVGKPFDPPALVRCIRRYVQVDDAAWQTSETVLPTVPTCASLANWPLIDGIDARDASTRLGGDVGLFGSMLQRLLLDCSDLPDLAVTPGSLTTLAARMHKLKGSAGTLGAHALARLAAHAESACRAQALAQIAPLTRSVVAELELLDRAARPMLEALQASSSQVERPLGAMDPRSLATLLAQLERRDLGAFQGFKTLAAHLRQQMDADAFRALSQNIDNLQFSEAASALQPLMEEHAEAIA